MSQTTQSVKFICWSCMKPVKPKDAPKALTFGYYQSNIVYFLGDCCKELSTEVIHNEKNDSI